MQNKYIEYEHLCYPRFEDMDTYGILHHSRYLLLVEEAKLAFMNDPEYFNTNVLAEDCKFLISEIAIAYINALKYKVGIPAKIKLKFYIKNDIKIVFEFQIYYENKLTCKGSAIHIVTDRDNNLKFSLPAGLIEKYEILKGEV